MTQQNQVDEELHVFQVFLAASHTQVDPRSIRKLHPPAPDIECLRLPNEPVGFEIVEFLDQPFKRTLEFSIATKNLLYQYLDGLNEPVSTQFKSKYSDADILVNFQPDCTKARAKSAIPHVFSELLLQPDGFEDLIDSFQERSLSKIILSISVQRPGINGPLFDIQAVGWVGDPCVDTIADKLGNTYTSSTPIELIAYIAGNPMFPIDVWRPKLESYLRAQPSLGPFQKVWVLNVNSRTIELTWPI